MDFDTDQTMHNQLLKIQELRRSLQIKDNIINELNNKIESNMNSESCQLKIDELKHALMLKEDKINELNCKIDNLKSSLNFLEELFQYECTNTRKVIVHTDIEGGVLF
jgi:chromosome segregation ATPase